MLDSLFELNKHGTSVRTEVTAGLTTFLTMAYIIFVQPAILSGTMFDIDTGIDFGAITTATCLSAALATLIMGLYARHPIALAPGMGANLFFVLSALPVAAAAGFAEPGGSCRRVCHGGGRGVGVTPPLPDQSGLPVRQARCPRS